MKHTVIAIAVFLGLLGSQGSWATTLPRITTPLTGNTFVVCPFNAPVTHTAELPPTETWHSYANTTLKFYSTINTLELRQIESTLLPVNYGYVLTVTGTLRYWEVGSHNPSAPIAISLTVSHDPTAPVSKVVDYYAYSNAYKSEFVIQSVAVTPQGTSTQPMLCSEVSKVVELNFTSQQTRFIAPTYLQTPKLLPPCLDAVSNELTIHWLPVWTAEEYEFEILHRDDYADNASTLSPGQIPYDFKENATRIVTKQTYYRIPMVYERGYLLYRVRAVGVGGVNWDKRLPCAWTGPSDGMVGSFSHRYPVGSGHMADKMNWQLSTTYSDEGKRKDVVQYYDGLNMSRQTIAGVGQNRSKLNVSLKNILRPNCRMYRYQRSKEIVAQEVIYDFNGRPAVQILPIPTGRSSIEFIPALNKNQQGQAYSWEDFDEYNNCLLPSDPLSSNATGAIGAGAYYSPNNPNTVGFNAFIPDSKGYPFTRVQYTPDNTGRTYRQTGVGETFKMDAGHETRYFYAKPNQMELDRMFGTEVGYAIRYQKNMVVDPNGQVSVAYLNPEGKTIATALSGIDPSNLLPLDSKPTGESASAKIEVDLMGGNTPDSLGHSMSINEHFVVTNAGTYTFGYNVNGMSLTYETCKRTNVCLDCIYDLEINLVSNSECVTEPLFTYTGTFGDLLREIETPNIDLKCVQGPKPIKPNVLQTEEATRLTESSYGGTPIPRGFPTTFDRNLEVGSYTLTKILTVNKNSADAYVELAYKDTCTSVFESILAAEIALIDTAGCHQSCSTCQDDATVPLEQCAELCPVPMTACELAKHSMRLDVSPGGQYGGYDVVVVNGTTVYTAAAYPLSVFNPSSALPSVANWQSLTNKPDLETVILTWDPATSPDLFLPHHPEYCMYTWCVSENSALNSITGKNHDVSISEVTTLDAAYSTGLLDESSPVLPYLQLLNADPFFASGYGLSRRVDFENTLNNPCGGGVSVLRVAMDAAYCQSQFQQAIANTVNSTSLGTNVTNPPLPCTIPSSYYPGHTFGSDPAKKDLEWQILKNLYLSYKEKYLYESRKQYSIAHDCYNGCIGSDSYWFHSTFFSSTGKNGSGESVEGSVPVNSAEMCGSVEGLYKDKTKRFTNRYDAFNKTNINLNGADLYGCLTNAQIASIQGQVQNIAEQYLCDTCKACPSSSDTTDVVDTCYGLNPLVKDLLTYLDRPSSFDPRTCTATFFMENGKIVMNPANKGDSVARKTCTIRIDNCDWSNAAVHLLSIRPFYNGGQGNRPTNEFTLTYVTVVGERVDTHEIHGVSECFPVNTCTSPLYCDKDSLLRPAPLNPFDGCVQAKLLTAQFNAYEKYGRWVDSMKADLRDKYYATCMKVKEGARYAYTDESYHFTLYYYDQAGNLVRTVPPSGVRLLSTNMTASVGLSRKKRDANGLPNGVPVLPTHTFITNYAFNSLNQTTWQSTPDAGRSIFFYDKLGRIAASQNAVQKPQSAYSYTWYDKLGRVVESGKMKLAGLLTQATVDDYDNWKAFLYNSTLSRTEITTSQYDAPHSTTVAGLFGQIGQNNLRGRVASILRFVDNGEQATGTYQHATHYSYNVTGHVPVLLQDYASAPLGVKAIAYNFDLVSGKVNEVRYSPDQPDEFRHRYTYDSELRIVKVETSTKGILWDTDAEYSYYRHGPLARVELGQLKVQGLDYLYSLQGWIKSVNGTTIERDQDAGRDGIAQGSDPTLNLNGPGYQSLHAPIAADAYGYVLSYYTGDYESIVPTANTSSKMNPVTGDVQSLYNGNIGRMYSWMQGLGGLGMNYRYDVLNRIKKQEAFEITPTGQSLMANDAYRMALSYDGNGNILDMLRNGRATNRDMDELKYHYLDAAGNVIPDMTNPPLNATNRLAYVDDAVAGSNYPESNPFNGTATDIDDQSVGNYEYDAIGNLIRDNAELIKKINWNLQNKITSIVKTDGTTITFDYDALGNRVFKGYSAGTVTSTPSSFPNKSYYVRDAQGNTMAIYEERGKDLVLTEQHIYGSSRLGIKRSSIVVPQPNQSILAPIDWQNTRPITTVNSNLERGNTQYELSNHLGNVLATISDRRMFVSQVPAGTSGVIAEVASASDYCVFGMGMPGRELGIGEYRYGMNGQEKDDEVCGRSSLTSALYWEYDTRLGRRWNTDPVDKPWMTPYHAFSNKPILNVDPNGATDGDYYDNATGKHLGNDKKDDNKVYMVQGSAEFKIEDVVSGGKYDNDKTGFAKDFGKDHAITSWTYSVADPKLAEYLPILDKLEGGYSDVKNDRGGKTNYGITMASFKRLSKSLLGIEGTAENLKRMTQEQAAKIIEVGFWQPSKATNISSKLVGWAYFDTYFNGGGSEVLKSTLSGFAYSGISGVNTVLSSYSEKDILYLFNAERRCRYARIIEKDATQSKFKAGWENRILKFEKQVLK